MLQQFSKLSERLIAASLLALVLMLNVLVVAPGLHERLHKDANHSDHQCAITLFAHGQVDSVSGEVMVPVPEAVPTSISIFTVSLQKTLAVVLPPGRAPPVLS